MKKNLFFLMSLAALAMTSCNSFENPPEMMNDGELILTRAGESVFNATNEAAFKRAVRDKKASIAIGADFTLTSDIELNYPVTIYGTTGKTLSTTASIVCTSDVTFKDLTIDATTSRGTGAITLAAENINVVLNNTKLTQRTAGAGDNLSSVGIGILYTAYNNSLRVENNSEIVLPNSYVRAICLSPETVKTINSLEIVDSKITMGTNISNPATMARGISISHIKTSDNKPIVIDNSTIEGGFYTINVFGPNTAVKFDVKNNSVLNGRCGFNIWSPNTVATISNSTIIGQNPYTGGWEEFANIKINDGANKCTFNIDNTKFEMYRAENNPNNSQLMVMTGGTGTCLNFSGTVEVYDYTKLTMHFIGSSIPGNSVTVDGLECVKLVEANEEATVL